LTRSAMHGRRPRVLGAAELVPPVSKGTRMPVSRPPRSRVSPHAWHDRHGARHGLDVDQTERLVNGGHTKTAHGSSAGPARTEEASRRPIRHPCAPASSSSCARTSLSISGVSAAPAQNTTGRRRRSSWPLEGVRDALLTRHPATNVRTASRIETVALELPWPDREELIGSMPL